MVGKRAILVVRERAFAAKVASAAPPVLHASAVGEDVTLSEWTWCTSASTIREGELRGARALAR